MTVNTSRNQISKLVSACGTTQQLARRGTPVATTDTCQLLNSHEFHKAKPTRESSRYMHTSAIKFWVRRLRS